MKKKLKNSLINGEKDDVKDLNEKADKLRKCKGTAAVIREYGEIVQTNKRTWIAYQHVKMFQKVKER